MKTLEPRAHPGDRIAVIGSGISGLAAAYLLSSRYEVHLFEKEPRLGGHTHTHLIEDKQTGTLIPIDTGFIVHNDHTYPNLGRLFEHLGIERQRSDMSFGVSSKQTGFEYSSRGLRGFFAQRRNLFRPRHYGFFRELMRFNREAAELLRTNDVDLAIGEYLERNHYSSDFVDSYLYPMAAAVWSTSLRQIRDFPALTLVKFFHNHGFLGIDTQFQWKTVKGGSSAYIAPLTAPYHNRIVTSARITRVLRGAGGVEIRFEDRAPMRFDQVVFATHGPQVLPLLDEPTKTESEVLSAFETSTSEVWLHTDTRIMPRRRDAWASWNYHIGDASPDQPAVAVTYHMNRLQQLKTSQQYFVTLNETTEVDPRKVLRKMEYSHPLYTVQSVRAQARWREISGKNRTHFCGAYWFYGFHEDGMNSALRVARSLAVKWDHATQTQETEPSLTGVTR